MPLMESKAVHGLAVPIDFETPKPHELWTARTYSSFRIEKAIEQKFVSILQRLQ